MSKKVFISHSGSDSVHAKNIADLLEAANINVRFDRRELKAGDSFLSFMEESLSTSDYCLLLWSKDASEKKWVRLEWEAALYKSVQESRSFIIIGRLESFPVPSLLAPRLMVDLFPKYDEGVQQVLSMWLDDHIVESLTGKAVASAEVFKKIESGQETIYITSDLFGISIPIKLNFEEPVVLIIKRIIDSLHLPKDLNYNNLFGLRLDYNLIYNSKVLNKELSLATQDVRAKEVIWLETKTTQYAHAQLIQSNASSGTYRSSNNSESGEFDKYAQSYLLTHIAENKLGL